MVDVLQFLLPLERPPREPEPKGPEVEPQRNTLELADPEAREAALDVRRSWIVEAPAGSGKTGLLIQRLLKLLAYGEIQRPEEVLAITFTRKATAELHTRVLEQIKAASLAAPLRSGASGYELTTRDLALAVLARDKERGWQLLQNPQQLNIRTIDSFCAELTGNLPLLSGGAGRHKPVDDSAPLYEVAATRTLGHLGGSDILLNEALERVLLHRDGHVTDCVRLISEMLSARDQWGELVPLDADELTEARLDGEVRPRLEKTLARVIEDALGEAQRVVPSDLLQEIALFAARLSDAPSSNGAPSPIADCSGLPHAPGSSVRDLPHWLALLKLLFTGKNEWRTSLSKNHLGFLCPEDDRIHLGDLLRRWRLREQLEPGLKGALCALRDLPPARYPDEQWTVAKSLFRVLRRALVELQILFAERGACDFTEIGLRARAVLRSEPDLLQTSASQLMHLLVDEMQDTSAGQYELLQLLTRGWDGRTQTVFLVGDPKQSIYLFRQARVARFLRTQEIGLLGDVPLGPLRLTANFRSQADLVQEFNQVFERILPSPNEVKHQRSEAVDVPFVGATPARAPGGRPAIHWHVRIEALPEAAEASGDSSVPLHRSEEANRVLDREVEQEAQEIRQVIEDFREQWPRRPGKAAAAGKPPRIAVLARNRNHLAGVVREFQMDRGSGRVAFRAVDVELLDERPEVLDLLALTRALLHPGDRVAWLAILHSPMCGLGLADLLKLTGEPPEVDTHATVAYLIRTRAHLLSPEGQRLLERTWRVLSAAHEGLGRTLFSIDVERTWRSLGADALLDAEQRNNGRRFLQLLRELESQPDPLSPALLKRKLGKLFAESPADPDAVELLTIHKAKGLEWDLVVVPSLHRGTGRDGSDLLNWLEFDAEIGAEPDVLLAPIQGRGEDSTALVKWMNKQKVRRERAEAKRLFYVACTRACEELHLFASPERKENGELSHGREGSLLHASWRAAEPAIQRQLGAISAPPSAPVLRFVPKHEAASASRGLALAASADGEHPELDQTSPSPPLLYRLPESFDPLARFRPEKGAQLPYPPASSLRRSDPFTRPEGSFGARAFGNTVHRFLELISGRLTAGASVEQLLSELPGWQTRLETAFRSEGLSRSASAREASRARSALAATLQDPTGRWLLSPRTGAQSERAFTLGSGEHALAAPRSLRADRVFFAGPEPLSNGVATHLWIVDFKTAERAGASVTSFLEQEKRKYEPQMQAYASALDVADGGSHPIVLALFYPLLTQMLYWPYAPKQAS